MEIESSVIMEVRVFFMPNSTLFSTRQVLNNPIEVTFSVSQISEWFRTDNFVDQTYIENLLCIWSFTILTGKRKSEKSVQFLWEIFSVNIKVFIRFIFKKLKSYYCCVLKSQRNGAQHGTHIIKTVSRSKFTMECRGDKVELLVN